MKFVIEKNIPLPPPARGRRGGSVYPLDKLGVGDSFYFEKGENRLRAVNTLSCARARFINKHPEKDFEVRSWGNGARIWRTK